MNKKGGIVGGICVVLAVIILGGILFIAGNGIYLDYKEYKEYENFCEKRSDLCFCERFECEFKTKWSSTEGLSEDTKELCAIATRLKDKKMIYRIGCEE